MGDEAQNSSQGSREINQQQSSANVSRAPFIFLTAALLLVILGGLFWIFTLSTGSEVGIGLFLLSFATGLTMIVLPCTLPLAFVIVPLVMGKGYTRGLMTALSFGAGVAITLSMYGIIAAIAGKTITETSGATEQTIETIKNWFYFIAGIIALLFAFGELGFIRFKLPTYGGAAPSFIQKHKGPLKPLLMGLFLGNIGVGCPHPVTPFLLGTIAIKGDIFYGWLLFFVHAIGRVLPLLFLAMLGILGINATRKLVTHRESLTRVSAWFMVFVGGFLLILGLFSHAWWVYSGQHTLFEEITQEERFTNILAERTGAENVHRHGPEEVVGKTGMFGLPLWLGNWTLVAIWIIPLWWYYFKKEKQSVKNGDSIQNQIS